jgi:hypothetical protein
MPESPQNPNFSFQELLREKARAAGITTE